MRKPELPAPAPRPRAASLSAGIVLLGLLILQLPSGPARAGEEDAAPGAVLTNESVVRLIMGGTPPSEIISRIRREPSRFDVEPEILAELREAGVPADVMREMIAAAAKARRDAPADPPPGPQGSIEMIFEDDPNLGPAANSVMAPEKLPRPGSLRDPLPVELAFAVICVDPTHVPEAWEHKTLLDGSFRRHRVLFFREGQEPAAGKGEKGMEFAPHPPSLSFPADAGLHRGIVAFAARLSGDERYTFFAGAEFDGLEVRAGETTRVHLKVRTLPRGRVKDEKGGDAKLPDDAFVSIGTVGEDRKGLASSVEIVKVDPPAAPDDRQAP